MKFLELEVQLPKLIVFLGRRLKIWIDLNLVALLCTTLFLTSFAQWKLSVDHFSSASIEIMNSYRFQRIFTPPDVN